MIVTTNYDKIIERATSSGYVVHDYNSDSVAADVRRNYPLLLKIHGTVDRMDGIVLSRRDYTDVRNNGAHAMETLHALLVTRPALLLDYRLHDPDLQLVLENIFGGRKQIPAHYMLAPDNIPDYERDVLTYSYGVNVITYPDGDHGEALRRFKASPIKLQLPRQPRDGFKARSQFSELALTREGRYLCRRTPYDTAPNRMAIRHSPPQDYSIINPC